MGNEMGNNNTSGQKDAEEDNTNAIDSKNLLNEAADADNVKGENQTVPAPEAKDLHEKVTGLASDVPTGAKDPHIENVRPGDKEQEENEVHPPTESPKAVMESIEASSKNNEIRPAPSQKDSEVHPPTESPKAVMEAIEACRENSESRPAPSQKDPKVPPPTESPKVVMEAIEACSENSESRPAPSQKDPEVPPPTESPKAVMEAIEACSENSECRPAPSQKDPEVPPPTESPKAVMEAIEACSENSDSRPAPSQKDQEAPPPTESPKAVMEAIEACSENSESRPAPLQKDPEVPPPTESSKAVMESIEACSENNEIRPSPLQKDSEVHEKAVESILEEILLVTSDHQREKQASMNEDQEENEVHHPLDESLKAAKSIDASGEHNEIEPAPPPNDSEVHEKPIDSNLGENQLGTSHHQLEKQAPISEEEEKIRNSSFNTKSTPHDPEPQQSLHLDSDQHDLDEVNANLFEEDSSGLLQGNKDFLGSSLKCPSEENSHFLGPDISNNLSENPVVEKKTGESLVKEVPSQEEKMPCSENMVGFDLSSLTTRTSDTPGGIGNKSNEELSIKENSIRNDSLNLQFENVVLDNSLNSHQEVSEPEDKCMVLTEETKIIGSGSEIEETPHEYIPTHFCEEPVKEPMPDEADGSQSEFKKVGTENEDYEMRSQVDISSHLRSTRKDCQIEEVKVAESACQVGVFVSNRNKASDGHHKDSEQELLVVSEHGTDPIPAELIVSDCRCEEEQPEEKKIVEEIEGKAEASYATVNDTEGSKTTKQCLSQPLPIQLAEAFLSQFSASIPSTSKPPIPELKRESCNELFVSKSSTSLTAKKLETVTETTSSASKSNVEGVKGEEVSAFATGSTEAHESLKMHRTETNPDNMNTHVQLRKSQSFDFDLRIEARGKESDRTPLLFQDKAAMESSSKQADVSLGNPVVLNVGYNQDALQYKFMAMEEKVITLERSDSEKSRTPFIGFSKEEEEEAQIVVTPQKQEATRELCNLSSKEAASTPRPKGKEKRKPRSSFFGNCLCCSTMIN